MGRAKSHRGRRASEPRAPLGSEDVPPRYRWAEFRAAWLIRWAVLIALFLWIAIGVIALVMQGVPAGTLWSVAFFIVFFLVFVAYYWSMAYVVDEYGVTYRGATEFVHFPWEEITEVTSSEMPLGGYYVSTTRGGFVLSNFIKERDRLVDLIVTRAGLFPIR